jgi:hypothetical protein
MSKRSLLLAVYVSLTVFVMALVIMWGISILV